MENSCIWHFSRTISYFLLKYKFGNNSWWKYIRAVFIKRFRSSHLEVFCKKEVLRNFAKFAGKYLCQSLFFNKVAGLRPVKKETLAQVFSCEFCETSKSTSGGCFWRLRFSSKIRVFLEFSSSIDKWGGQLKTTKREIRDFMFENCRVLKKTFCKILIR